MAVREIQGHLEEMYGAEVSPTLIPQKVDYDGAKLEARAQSIYYPVWGKYAD